MVEVQTQVRVASGVEAIVVKTADRVEPLDSECIRCDMGEKCLDNIDAVFDHDRMIRDSSLAQFILALKCCGRKGMLHYLHFSR